MNFAVISTAREGIHITAAIAYPAKAEGKLDRRNPARIKTSSIPKVSANVINRKLVIPLRSICDITAFPLTTMIKDIPECEGGLTD
jgi:hypothetical protein